MSNDVKNIVSARKEVHTATLLLLLCQEKAVVDMWRNRCSNNLVFFVPQTSWSKSSSIACIRVAPYVRFNDAWEKCLSS